LTAVSQTELVDRLAALPTLSGIPRGELEWLVAHGQPSLGEAGDVLARKGEPIEHLYILLEGHIAVRVDRGAGLRRAMEWRKGDTTGLLPYSRMTGPPGDTYLEERTELLLVHRDHFPEMIHSCPSFTAMCVHQMLDRARGFNTSDLQDDKMISLGKLAAGLAHELNNPASATARGAELLLTGLAEAEEAARALGAAGLTAAQLAAIDQMRSACLAERVGAVLSPIQQVDREDGIAAWLDRHGSDPGHAVALAGTAVTIEGLDMLAEAVPAGALDVALRWVASGCSLYALAVDVREAAKRIHELVAAVKGFTHMDHLAGPDYVEVEGGLRDTIRVVASKARSKGVALTLDVEDGLPLVHATGGELNQVWLNLIDNALDAAPESGHVSVDARRELDRVAVRVIDDGPGIAPDVLPKIFDPFFTTKPPGQGTGLGLDITRRLLGRWHGELSVESKPGRTEFRVSLATQRA
jgi:signal transduction histidine kinase